MAAGIVVSCSAVSGGGVYCCCVAFLPLLPVAPLQEGSYYQTRSATVRIEGSKRTKNTHTHNTHIYMLLRVAAAMAPRTHNRRRVTGSSGGRREGRESEWQRPNMSRRVFTSAVLLLLVVMMYCGSGAASAQEGGATDASTLGLPFGDPMGGRRIASGVVKLPQEVDLFVPQTTQVLPKDKTGPGTTRGLFLSPSLVSAGGVIAAFAEGHRDKYEGDDESTMSFFTSDVVAGYIDSAWNWSTLLDRVNQSAWKAHTVLGAADTKERLGVVRSPTTTTKGNKVFLLGSSYMFFWNEEGGPTDVVLELVVGTVTNSTGGELSERIKWGDPRPLFNSNYLLNGKRKLKSFFPSGGSGAVLEDGTLVFPLMAKYESQGETFSMLAYSTDDGENWVFSSGTSPKECYDPRITEWEGSLLMISDCENGQRVYESRDVGRTWTEAVGTLPGVWVNVQSRSSWDGSLHVEALITTTIEERKVMLYTQRWYASREGKATALYLWVTDNKRSFYFGPVAMGNDVNWDLASTLLYSDGNLHLLQRRDHDKGSAISLFRLTEELSTIKSVLRTWVQKDIFFSSFSIPTDGLVAVLSDAANNDTWNDEYRCLNAKVTNATKVEEGLQLTEPNSGVLWPVNGWGHGVRHVFLSHNFTLVASVTIEEAPSKNTPLLTAMWEENWVMSTMGLSYTADNKWETVSGGGKKTRESGTWEPKKEYQVALMLHGRKASVYIDGESLWEEEASLTGEEPLEIVGFCFGACDVEFKEADEEKDMNSQNGRDQNSPVTVKNVFLYNRPLNSTEMRAIKDRIPVPTRGPESQAEDVSQTIASAGSAAPAPARTTVGRTANTQHAASGSFTSAWSEGTAGKAGDGGANDDDGSTYGRGLLPLLLLLGLWGFAAV
ncbi:trans-sialidase, putative [Trypanosoma cruzi marinkellei]|uniref:Trans-sialidase, putative n=1 Tax=Trypanosoma cruzi marinkellei TaxID=85056 RepID=K2MPE7_TRYCR|nr:trans-sialidase, putative [Trypanosoma cruzi marinkellei]